MACLSRPYPFKFFKGCLPQILLGLFLNTFSHVYLNEPLTMYNVCKITKTVLEHDLYDYLLLDIM